MYRLLLECCEKYYDNLAWLFPEATGNNECVCLNIEEMSDYLRYQIPDLYQDKRGLISVPPHNLLRNIAESTEKSYDQFALLDFIEYLAVNIWDVNKGISEYSGMKTISFLETDNIFKYFQSDINGLFDMMGLLYYLNDEKQIERRFEYEVLSDNIEKNITNVKEDGIRDILNLR